MLYFSGRLELTEFVMSYLLSKVVILILNHKITYNLLIKNNKYVYENK